MGGHHGGVARRLGLNGVGTKDSKTGLTQKPLGNDFTKKPIKIDQFLV
jgi:hypothetical protein